MLTRWLITAFLIAFYGLVGVGLVSGSTGSVPDQSRLVTVTGRMDDLAIHHGKSDGAPSFGFRVQPQGKAGVSLHMRSFGVAGIVQRMQAGSGQTVTVRYRAGLFGNPAYAISGPAGSIVAFEQARAFLDAHDARHKVDYQNGLILYGLGPILMWAIHRWFRRTRPVTIPRPSAASFAKTESANSLRLQRTLMLAGFVLVLIIVFRDALAKSEVLGPLVGVFGPRPLGLEPTAAFPIIVVIGLAPLVLMTWHLIAALHHIRDRDGVIRAGTLVMLLAIYEHWDLPEVRRHALWSLGGLVLFSLAAIAWIVATLKAGV